MRNWKYRREIPWATFCWKHQNLFFSRYISKTKEWSQVVHNQVFCNCSSALRWVKPRTWADEWSRKQETCAKMAGAHPRPQFSVEERMFMVRICVLVRGCASSTLLTIPILAWVRAVLGRALLPTFLFKLKPYWTYLIVIVHHCLSAKCPLIPKLHLNLLIVPRTLPVSVYFKTTNTRSFTENCGLGCAPAIVMIFVQFFCFLLHSSVPVLGFTYIIKH